MKTLTLNRLLNGMQKGGFYLLMAILTMVLPAIATGQPYPASEVITGISIGKPVKYTEPRAGDNWPITWAADGHMYVSWGDGQGSRPPQWYPGQ
jgi:hypothetical protein